jgi:thiamine biosynthesis lipoprotein
MGTVISLRVIGHADTPAKRAERDAAVLRAAGWFRNVEAVCSRFDSNSELRRLSSRIGTPVPVSPLLSRSIHFALALAEQTEGAFDPTVGCRMEARGFDRSYLTGETVPSGVPIDESTSFRDVEVDVEAGTLTLRRPLLLDLGAVAKGLAVDLAARELAPLGNYSIDAGGDLYLGGHDEKDEPWLVGIRHPRDPDSVIESVRVTDTAVCTSGDYERPGSDGKHHVVDPRKGEATALVASVTVIAPSAMVADGLGTAAMVLGPLKGLDLIEGQGAEGLIITRDLQSFATPGFAGLTTASTPPARVHRTSVA